MNTRNTTKLINSTLHLLLILVIGAASSAHASDEQVLVSDNLILDANRSVSIEDLGSSRGKQGFDTLQQMNESDQRAWLENNKLDSGLTGNNMIENGALEGIQGIATIIQNTGNQVVIQESTLLNITMAP